MFILVFFQAEDGIRDVERSRGLGDVYKRQVLIGAMTGGAKLSATINRNLAAAAQELGLSLIHI